LFQLLLFFLMFVSATARPSPSPLPFAIEEVQVRASESFAAWIHLGFVIVHSAIIVVLPQQSVAGFQLSSKRRFTERLSQGDQAGQNR
jgi:hypothetical protein